MKQQLSIITPLILLMLFAQAAMWLVELPTYPVSAVHPAAVFAAGIGALYCLNLGELRRSYPLYASGLGFTFLTAAMSIYPDLWLRWPAASLAGLVIAQAGAALIPQKATAFGRFLIIMTLLFAGLSLLPLASTVYFPWPAGLRYYIAGGSALLLLGAAWLAWHRRQRKYNFVAAVTMLFWTLLAVGLLLMTYLPGYNAAGYRIVFEESLLIALLTLGGTFVFDHLHAERRLRSHRNRDLQASMRDPLTNVANRRALETYGPVLVSQSRDAGRAISLLMADIDHFKRVNDTYGHQVGDTVLRSTAEQLTGFVRQSDMVARYGGEEFVILLPGSPLAPALRLAERIRNTIEGQSYNHEGQEISPTISIGVATAFPEEPASLPELIKRADANLYRAKRQGRNRVCADELPAADF